MHSCWKTLRLAFLALLLVSSAGCGGLGLAHSISPATFLLPGLMKATPPPPVQTDPAAIPAPPIELTNNIVAQLR